jgi:mannosyltransferase OCH1-like enzyme
MIHTYKDLEKISNIKVQSVPKIMWRTGPYKVNSIPPRVMAIFRKAMQINPGYFMFYFDDDDCRQFIADYYPDYLVDYDAIVPTAYKADIWRYAVLSKFGGCYADLTQQVEIPYHQLCQNVKGVFCRDHGKNLNSLYNAVMCSAPNDTIVNEALRISIRNIRNRYYGGNTLAITGPIVLGRAYKNLFEGTIRSAPIKLGNNDTYLILEHDTPNIKLDGKIIGKIKTDWHHDDLYDGVERKHYNELWYSSEVYKDTVHGNHGLGYGDERDDRGYLRIFNKLFKCNP